MHIPLDKIEVAPHKIKNYLLIHKKKNDKSVFLAKLGYTTANWEDLVNDIKKVAANNESFLQQTTPFGDIFEVKGQLKNFNIVTIWLLKVETDKYNFVTLFPDK